MNYADGYKPTMHLRIHLVPIVGTMDSKEVLQQEWRSDYQGFPAVWRDVPTYTQSIHEYRTVTGSM